MLWKIPLDIQLVKDFIILLKPHEWAKTLYFTCFWHVFVQFRTWNQIQDEVSSLWEFMLILLSSPSLSFYHLAVIHKSYNYCSSLCHLPMVIGMKKFGSICLSSNQLSSKSLTRVDNSQRMSLSPFNYVDAE